KSRDPPESPADRRAPRESEPSLSSSSRLHRQRRKPPETSKPTSRPPPRYIHARLSGDGADANPPFGRSPFRLSEAAVRVSYEEFPETAFDTSFQARDRERRNRNWSKPGSWRIPQAWPRWPKRAPREEPFRSPRGKDLSYSRSEGR